MFRLFSLASLNVSALLSNEYKTALESVFFFLFFLLKTASVVFNGVKDAGCLTFKGQTPFLFHNYMYSAHAQA